VEEIGQGLGLFCMVSLERRKEKSKPGEL